MSGARCVRVVGLGVAPGASEVRMYQLFARSHLGGAHHAAAGGGHGDRHCGR
jgi:hypothetical protein